MFSSNVFSKDYIIRNNGQKIDCTAITGEDSLNIYFQFYGGERDEVELTSKIKKSDVKEYNFSNRDNFLKKQKMETEKKEAEKKSLREKRERDSLAKEKISSFGQSENGYINITPREKVFDKSNLLPYLFGEKIKKGWQVKFDENDNLVFSVVVDSLKGTKDALFDQALSFFTYHYVNGKNVIQTQDKEAGLIMAKGSFPERCVRVDNVDCFGGNVQTTYNSRTNHIIRIDAKENKVRIIVTISDVEIKGTVSSVSYMSPYSNRNTDIWHSRKIKDVAPLKNYNDTTGFYRQFCIAFNTKLSKKQYLKYVEKQKVEVQKGHDMDIRIFDGINTDILSIVSSFEQSLRKGNTSIEKSDW